MGSHVILERNGWRLTSYGHGAAFLLEDIAQSKSVFFQYGDDAATFSERVLDAQGWPLDHCERVFAEYSEVMQ